MAIAAIARLIAIGNAYDLNDDEIYYSDLGVSLRHGVFPPKFDHIPFLLHPPLFFALSSAWETLFRPGATLLELVFRVRELNIACAIVTAGVVFLVGRGLTGRMTGVCASLLFALDPFLLQINGRALLETSTWMFALIGWMFVLPLLRNEGTHSLRRAIGEGLILGLAMVDKDIAVVIVIPPLLVAIICRWAYRRTLWTITAATLVPTAIYLIALASVGSLGQWASQETTGLQRLLGIKKVTGFGEGGHPSIVSTLIRQIPLYGVSYGVCALGIGASIYLLVRQRRRDLQLIACITLAGVLTLVYATLFGTIETQMFYFPAIPALIALPVAITVALRMRGAVDTRRLRRVALIGFSLVMLGESAIWLDIRSTPDDGLTRLVAWFSSHDHGRGVIADDTDVAWLALDQYGFDAVPAGTPRTSRAEHVRYITLMSGTFDGNYGTLDKTQALWYEKHGTLLYRFAERSYGEVSVYRPKQDALW